jgi:hypothetical protein
MNCFYHPTVAAVGICKSCAKGLCPECAVDVGKGLACKGRCEEDVKAVASLIDRTVKRSPLTDHILKTARSNRYLGAIFYLAFGSLFTGFGIFTYLQDGTGEPVVFLGAMGLCFLTFGLVILWKSILFPRTDK